MRPWCSAIFGSRKSRRSAFRRSSVPSSSAPISREYPATSAARIAARRRVEAMAYLLRRFIKHLYTARLAGCESNSVEVSVYTTPLPLQTQSLGTKVRSSADPPSIPAIWKGPLRVQFQRFDCGLANGGKSTELVLRCILANDGSRNLFRPSTYALASRLAASWIDQLTKLGQGFSEVLEVLGDRPVRPDREKVRSTVQRAAARRSRSRRRFRLMISRRSTGTFAIAASACQSRTRLEAALASHALVQDHTQFGPDRLACAITLDPRKAPNHSWRHRFADQRMKVGIPRELRMLLKVTPTRWGR